MTLPMVKKQHPRREQNSFELRLVGKVLQHARIRAGLSPTMLGMLANVNITQIIAVEAGRRDIATTTLMRLCQAMNITMKQFWTIENPQGKPMAPSLPVTTDRKEAPPCESPNSSPKH